MTAAMATAAKTSLKKLICAHVYNIITLIPRQLFYFVKCWRLFQEANSIGLYLSSQKEKESS